MMEQQPGAQPEIGNGGAILGSGDKASSRQRLGVWGQSPHPPEARGSGGGAPSARYFAFFGKNNLILGLF